MKKLVLATVGLLVALIIGVGIYMLLSPNLSVEFMKMSFETMSYSRAMEYEDKVFNVKVLEDIEYDSSYKKNTMDIISPKNNEEALPLILWVHGGGYVGGDKRNNLDYGIYLANENYIVVNINYELAPSSKYPNPLKQIGEAYKFLIEHHEEYNVDPNKVIFGGDSAGAQLVGQFLNIQTNSDYASIMNIRPVVEKEKIMGAILFAGPYNLEEFTSLEDGVVNFLYNKAAQVYFGNRKWKNSPEAKEANVITYVTENFPSTFLTDGNKNTYDKAGLELEEKLEELKVYVKGVFFSEKEVTLEHQYQFAFDDEYATKNFEELRKFLKQINSEEIVVPETDENTNGYIEIDFNELKSKIDNNEDFVLTVGKSGCSYCVKFQKTLNEVADKYVVNYIDTSLLSVEDKIDLGEILSVNGFPTTVFFKNGVETNIKDRVVGAVSADKVIKKLDQLDYIN